MDSVDLTLNDLTPTLVAELKEFIEQYYSGLHVNIYVSPLTKFGELPSEILSKVLRSRVEFL